MFKTSALDALILTLTTFTCDFHTIYHQVKSPSLNILYHQPINSVLVLCLCNDPLKSYFQQIFHSFSYSFLMNAPARKSSSHFLQIDIVSLSLNSTFIFLFFCRVIACFLLPSGPWALWLPGLPALQIWKVKLGLVDDLIWKTMFWPIFKHNIKTAPHSGI